MKIKTYEQFQTTPKQSEVDRNEAVDKAVLEIILNVRKNGDKAVLAYTKEHDNVALDSIVVTEKEFEQAEQLVSADFNEAIDVAIKNITEFHKGQLEKSWFYNKPDGVMLGQQVTPIDRVGVYVPGGTAAYPSTVLMDLIPAKLAGVPSIALTTPPQQDGTVNPHVLVAAKKVGVDIVYKVGGAQAIAALAYGTESVQKVDKIVGPGNAYVARAKKWVFGDVAIDMIAGPSEILVVADETARVDFVAADLLAQAEHDVDAVSICIATDEKIAAKIQAEVERQLVDLERKEIASASLQNNGQIIVVDTLKQAFKLVNDIAPEHLQLMINNATDHLGDVRNAGAIFLGNYSPEALGDYMAGPNHTLPTSGTAKFASPLGTYDFIKRSSIIRYTEDALLKEATHIETIAKMERLQGHAQSITIRRNNNK